MENSKVGSKDGFALWLRNQLQTWGGSALDRGQLVDSRALIKIKILFGLHRDISAQKASKISIFCRFFLQKQNMEEKNIPHKK
jgi:hypothetical protein